MENGKTSKIGNEVFIHCVPSWYFGRWLFTSLELFPSSVCYSVVVPAIRDVDRVYEKMLSGG